MKVKNLAIVTKNVQGKERKRSLSFVMNQAISFLEEGRSSQLAIATLSLPLIDMATKLPAG
jgi:hypothetical protein